MKPYKPICFVAAVMISISLFHRPTNSFKFETAFTAGVKHNVYKLESGAAAIVPAEAASTNFTGNIIGLDSNQAGTIH